MPKFGSPMGRVPPAKGKGGGQALLPNRAALHKLVGGTPDQKTMQSYAKATPSGAAVIGKTYPAIMAEGEEGTSVF